MPIEDAGLRGQTSERLQRRSVALAITGASGAIYGVRTLAAFLEAGCEIDLIVTDYGRRLLRDELGDAAAVERLGDYLRAKYGSGIDAGDYTLVSNRDLGARLASGSQRCEAMAIVPCSMKTMAAIAHGLSRSLVERGADVMLKEKRALVLVPRETPLSLPQLRNMVACAEAGAVVLPAMPAFYHLPRTIDDLAAFVAGKVLSVLGFPHRLYDPWKDVAVTPSGPAGRA